MPWHRGPAARTRKRQPAPNDISNKGGDVGPSGQRQISRLHEHNTAFAGHVSMCFEDNPETMNTEG